jgi:hypothetical protein
MNLNQVCRLRTLVDAALFPKPGGPISDLSRDDANAILSALKELPNPRLVEALEAVLLFHSGTPWDSEKRLQWSNIVGHSDATTKALCNFIRSRLDEPCDRMVDSLARTALMQEAP